jgi:hypothetical protein
VRAGRSTNEINTLLLTCRGVNLNTVKPDANTVIAFALAEALKARTNLFETNGVQLGTIAEGDAGLTFTCDLTLKLKRPFKL